MIFDPPPFSKTCNDRACPSCSCRCRSNGCQDEHRARRRFHHRTPPFGKTIRRRQQNFAGTRTSSAHSNLKHQNDMKHINSVVASKPYQNTPATRTATLSAVLLVWLALVCGCGLAFLFFPVAFRLRPPAIRAHRVFCFLRFLFLLRSAASALASTSTSPRTKSRISA